MDGGLNALTSQHERLKVNLTETPLRNERTQDSGHERNSGNCPPHHREDIE